MEPWYEGPYYVVRHNRDGAYILIDQDWEVLGWNFAVWCLE
jgi:PHD/YefM family antitoxin component YafN of YafNO toxin-antitoxin module